MWKRHISLDTREAVVSFKVFKPLKNAWIAAKQHVLGFVIFIHHSPLFLTIATCTVAQLLPPWTSADVFTDGCAWLKVSNDLYIIVWIRLHNMEINDIITLCTPNYYLMNKSRNSHQELVRVTRAICNIILTWKDEACTLFSHSGPFCPFILP